MTLTGNQNSIGRANQFCRMDLLALDLLASGPVALAVQTRDVSFGFSSCGLSTYVVFLECLHFLNFNLGFLFGCRGLYLDL